MRVQEEPIMVFQSSKGDGFFNQETYMRNHRAEELWKKALCSLRQIHAM